jgi:beta-lactamase superfamily II metal-dependent hydrolase
MAKLVPPDDAGVVVRMYRQGHGDCFLLAFPRDGGGEPVRVLIDCGRWDNSEVPPGRVPIDQIVEHLRDACGNRLDVAIATHEHIDHLNGIVGDVQTTFDQLVIDRTWLAWTEKPGDKLASDLREGRKQAIQQLAAARDRLATALGPTSNEVEQIDQMIELETGSVVTGLPSIGSRFAAGNDEPNENQRALALLASRAAANQGVSYLSPHMKPFMIPGTNVRVYVLGPPRNEALLYKLDPLKKQSFPEEDAHGFSFGAAALASEQGGASPFAPRYRVDFESARNGGDPFFTDHYGKGRRGLGTDKKEEVADNAPFRRIDQDWLASATDLALNVGNITNNLSLVLAFELPETKKVLLFVGDAQRGNWESWDDKTWLVDGARVSANDLFGRTVLYKVGHHGSHNATLAGNPDSPWPNLSWMAAGEAADEFTAMITAVRKWAVDERHWNHPLPSIKEALLEKASGRVFQTDTNPLKKPQNVTDAAWKTFTDRAVFNDLYFDYTIFDH